MKMIYFSFLERTVHLYFVSSLKHRSSNASNLPTCTQNCFDSIVEFKQHLRLYINSYV